MSVVLKEYSNRLYEIIKECDLEPHGFMPASRFEGKRGIFQIRYKKSRLTFIVFSSDENSCEFFCRYTTFPDYHTKYFPPPGFIIGPDNKKKYKWTYTNFKFIEPHFKKWLETEVKKKIKEDITPNGIDAVEEILSSPNQETPYFPPIAKLKNNEIEKDVFIEQKSDNWDIFICHASEDKDGVARPLAEALRKAGLSVWYDEFSLKLGDKLRESIEKGLKNSKYGLVIISPHFFEKQWPRRELDGLFTLENSEEIKILPVWHHVDEKAVCKYSPILAGRVAAKTSDGLDSVVLRILERFSKFPSPSVKYPAKAESLQLSKAESVFEEWIKESENRFQELVKEKYIDLSQSPYAYGYWSAAYYIFGEYERLSQKKFLDILGSLKLPQTGWNPLWIPTREEIKPYPYKDCIECWLAENSRFKDPFHSDFWRASPNGFICFLRGYFEDGLLEEKKIEPGKVFDFLFPLKDVGFCLLHAKELTKKLNPAVAASILIRFEWTGLSNRVLWSRDPLRRPDYEKKSRQNTVTSSAKTNPEEISSSFEKLVKDITANLYSIFDFFSLSPEIIKEELRRFQNLP